MNDNTKSTNLPAAAPAPTQRAMSVSVFGDAESFETAQRMARALASSNLVPAQYQNNLANCIILLDVARRMGLPVLQVASGLNVIQGRPSWGAQFIIAAINASGLFSPLRFEWRGTENTDEWACRAYATDLRTGDRLTGPWVGIKMAKDERWYERTGSKWRTMPEQMMVYRAGSFFGRIYAGHILSGMQTSEELADIGEVDVTERPQAPAPSASAEPPAANAAALNAEIGARRTRRRAGQTIDAATGEIAPPPHSGARPPLTRAEAASIEAGSEPQERVEETQATSAPAETPAPASGPDTAPHDAPPPHREAPGRPTRAAEPDDFF